MRISDWSSDVCSSDLPVSDARGPESSGQPITLEFDDNRLLALLSGEHDRYLARIEQQFGVAVTPRGNLLMISGAADARSAERRVGKGFVSTGRSRWSPYH